jgi:hypothetical protein
MRGGGEAFEAATELGTPASHSASASRVNFMPPLCRCPLAKSRAVLACGRRKTPAGSPDFPEIHCTLVVRVCSCFAANARLTMGHCRSDWSEPAQDSRETMQ